MAASRATARTIHRATRLWGSLWVRRQICCEVPAGLNGSASKPLPGSGHMTGGVGSSTTAEEARFVFLRPPLLPMLSRVRHELSTRPTPDAIRTSLHDKLRGSWLTQGFLERTCQPDALDDDMDVTSHLVGGPSPHGVGTSTVPEWIRAPRGSSALRFAVHPHRE